MSDSFYEMTSGEKWIKFQETVKRLEHYKNNTIDGRERDTNFQTWSQTICSYPKMH